MAQLDPVDLAKTAYAAYGRATGGRNYQGRPMPAWDDLGFAIQHAWTEAARAVFNQVVAPLRTESGS